MPSPLLVHTVGHSTRAVEEVVQMLRRNGITELVDIRSFPNSRANPQWNQSLIADELPADISYRWLPRLGGRRHTPSGVPTPNDGWRVKGFRDYADYMGTPEFAEGLDELLAIAGDGRPAIMCSEAVPWRCHRRLVTDALLVRDVEVRHILSPTLTRPGELSELARVDGVALTYPRD